MVRVCALVLTGWTSAYPMARTIVLLIGAMASLAIAVLSMLRSRIKLYRPPVQGPVPGSVPQYAPRQLPRMRRAGITIAALLSSVAFLVAIWLPPRDAHPAQELTPQPAFAPIALPPARAIGPGVGIFVEYPDGSGGMGCTAGFLVHSSTGQAGFLTAGHCNRPHKASKVTMNLGDILPYARLGTFSRTVNEGDRTEQHDIGLIVLDGEDVPQTSAIAASLPVSGVTTDLWVGEQLCKYGMSTGQEECGQVLDITASKVVFTAAGRCGDSGGPVYAVQSDGTAAAVGIDIRGGNPLNPKAGCSAPAKFSVAELLQPWLQKWKLTVVTNQPPGPR
ncbi:endopeptidase [Mycobacterium rhizamassiliense]|uniref:Endopeptidase n=1 Tax=Mycobacterium rhizamassiliense TaxID=1841860 RepID=A0A2U3P059_9MYCO|nr:S1 family peptidase [Mycobacterium rhizamassiliense]SPM37108.1 endopeptidase [Mycobacterium rhizamassiliense]